MCLRETLDETHQEMKKFNMKKKNIENERIRMSERENDDDEAVVILFPDVFGSYFVLCWYNNRESTDRLRECERKKPIWISSFSIFVGAWMRVCVCERFRDLYRKL